MMNLASKRGLSPISRTQELIVVIAAARIKREPADSQVLLVLHYVQEYEKRGAFNMIVALAEKLRTARLGHLAEAVMDFVRKKNLEVGRRRKADTSSTAAARK